MGGASDQMDCRNANYDGWFAPLLPGCPSAQLLSNLVSGF